MTVLVVAESYLHDIHVKHSNSVLLLDGGGSNKQHSADHVTAKLDRKTEELPRK